MVTLRGAGIHKLQRGVYWLVLGLLWAGSSARFQVLVYWSECSRIATDRTSALHAETLTFRGCAWGPHGRRFKSGPAHLDLHSGIMRALVVVSGFLLL